MSDERARLENDIMQLTTAIAGLANIPDAQALLRTQLDEKRRRLATLSGVGGQVVQGNQTTIQGDVTGAVMSGTFAGPVTVGGTTVNHGPQISGPINASRDVNIATNQSIRNVTTGGGDYAEGAIDKRSGVFVSGGEIKGPVVGENTGTINATYGHQYTLSDIRGSNINLGSTLTNATQSISAAGHLDENDRKELTYLVRYLQTALQQLPVSYQEDGEAVAEAAGQAVDVATKPKPNKRMVAISLDGLKQAAANLATVLPLAIDIAGKIAERVRGMLG